ncbi:MAG: hypothetical protein TH68_10065 [Candidatus Synechococcus spongiarum 142]|uniref:CRISPR-associated protein Cas5 n=1 Tax=Candidatus Synechococcus spongiarum 142 TaxID=1608213 RepID=A0A6N3X2K7_9SYNE|nr:MAG: hypothetical protein TH68_10065 [Candidatus Synechococcus spongiarum 142]
MPFTLLIPLVGPLQSWGLDARFDLRQTAPEPSKSAVIGLLCCCLGRDRGEPVDDLTGLRFGVRVDEEGILLRDFHTAVDVIGSSDSKLRTVVSNRWYLADAAFLAGFEGPHPLLEQIHQVLIHPHWMPCLGRRSCIPSVPLFAGGIEERPLLEALEKAPLLKASNRAGSRAGSRANDAKLRMVIEDPDGSQVRPDQPLASFSQRQFGHRRVHTYTLSVPLAGGQYP